MTATFSREMYEGVLTPVITKRYDLGAVSKTYLDIKSLMPIDLVWVKPLTKIKRSDVLHHYNMMYKRHYNVN
jgi:hypothetical protein